MINLRYQIIYSLALLLLTLLVFETTSLDMWVQSHWYHEATRQWLVNRDEAISHFVFYDGAKMVLWLLFFGLAGFLLYALKVGIAPSYRKRIVVVLLTMALAPALVHQLKVVSNIACPRDLSAFDGKLAYKKLFDVYMPDEQPERKQKCFPAAHASGGYALMSLYFLAVGAWRRRMLLLTGLLAGSLMGAYKMLIGDHFLSHTLVSMELCWLLSCAIALLSGLDKVDMTHGH